MLGILITMAILSVIELFVCHFTLWWILAIVARGLFCLRVVGATFKVKALMKVEAVALGAMVVWNMVFAKESVPWLRIILFATFGFISVVIMVIDDVRQVYVSQDIDDEEVF